MAKRKDTGIVYFFKLGEGAHRINVEVAKFVDGEEIPAATYIVRGQSPETLWCDCPGYRHASQNSETHKHCRWARRWLKIMETRDPQKPVYYDDDHDCFRPLGVFDGSAIDAVLEQDGNQKGTST